MTGLKVDTHVHANFDGGVAEMAKSVNEMVALVRQYTHSAPPRGTASRYRRYELTPARPAVLRKVSTLAR